MAPKKKQKTEVQAIRLRKLEVTDFKALDHLMLDFPPPKMADDPDVFVLGSRNGLGKTSILEASALVLLTSSMEEGLRKEFLRFARRSHPRDGRSVDITDLFVRSGTDKSILRAELDLGSRCVPVKLTVSRSGWLDMDSEKTKSIHSKFEDLSSWDEENIIDSLASFSPEPLVAPPLLYFHSYRKVSEGAPEFGTWVERSPERIRRWRRPGDWSMSAFKMELLALLMHKADLFETVENGKEESAQALDQLNNIIERYAGGRIDKLRPASDNTVDFRIMPSGGSQSYSFDGLSSGQKEVISTLFLTWRYTRNAPGILLIDEPELHLNPEWQRDFIRQLHAITPKSQFIIATHSEDIFDSVAVDRRLLLGN